ncbi:hypothetical protein NL676_025214 [Syzygium grande]|nr:hypothetical protein NL676_025214 [Syzygium grande]
MILKDRENTRDLAFVLDTTEARLVKVQHRRRWTRRGSDHLYLSSWAIVQEKRAKLWIELSKPIIDKALPPRSSRQKPIYLAPSVLEPSEREQPVRLRLEVFEPAPLLRDRIKRAYKRTPHAPSSLGRKRRKPTRAVAAAEERRRRRAKREEMDRYHRVEKPREETPIDENEIRITSQGRMRSYITYAMTLLQEKGSKEIVFKAMGRAINKTVTIVELIKRRIVGLHQVTSIGSIDITDTWEPLEEGLVTLETTRHVSMITITLSKKELDTSSVGYQPPLPAEMVKASPELYYEGEGSPNGRGRGRGGRGRPRGRGNGFVNSEYDDGGWDRNQGYARGRGRGRARGFVAAGGEDTMDLMLIHSKTEDTIKNRLLRTAAVAVEGELAEEAVVTDQMDRSRQLHKLHNAFLKDCGSILICTSSIFYYRPLLFSVLLE